MAKSFKKNSKEESVVNYGKIKRNLIMRDTNGDNRYVERAVQSKKHKKEKYGFDYRNYL